MLVDFTVENFRSYKKEATLSMIASSDTSLENNVFPQAHGSIYDVLRTAAIFGANASGKSNMLFGLETMRRQVLHPVGQPIIEGFVPFKLDARTELKPVTMEITFLAEETPYRYGFVIDAEKNRVLEEWLHYFPKRRRLLFHRTTTVKKGSVVDESYKFGEDWRGEAKSLTNRTRPDALFISLAYSFNHDMANTVVEWFRRSLRVLNRSAMGYTMDRMHQDKNWKRIITEMLGKADLSIEKITTESVDISDKVPGAVLKRWREDKGANAKFSVVEMNAWHRGVDKAGKRTLVPFELDEESAGTQQFIAMLGAIIYVLRDGSVLVVDEFDKSMHPIIAKTIISLFQQEKTNPFGAQLILSSHDVSLLDQSHLLRRDQIILVDKDEDGGSDMVTLWDYKVRNRENLLKGYLAGRYGAVPFAEVLLEQDLFGKARKRQHA
jgi:AAA15 family ATPase/GTPase